MRAPRRLGRILLTAALAVTPLVLAPGTAQAHGGSGQPSRVWIATSPDVGELGTIHSRELTVDENTTLFFTGVVHRDTRIRWSMARFGGSTFSYATQNPPDDNCVVHHEDEAVRAGAIGLGTWSVSFAYIGWEDPNHVTIIENFYTLTIQPASGGGGGGDDDPPPCQPGQICE